ncbi:GNAT family N-acetyltransferase [Butyrivibrio sp. MC2021]|uniref:GNAT family N-acetyltransferase n=1 Tax=Butyrivibrio sp. MC2021 TaxID=1408306 RepID=UPI0009DE110E|nr:GNAT family N-acetyltransferase [Butyrivibrio sp. MC2021]
MEDMLAQNKSGWTLLEYLKVSEEEIENYDPVTGAFAVISVNGEFLIGYNFWRGQWEFPAGRIEQGETAREAAIRELFEETHQAHRDLRFAGLFKVRDCRGIIKYQAVFTGELSELQPFIHSEGDEMERIRLWDLKEDIGYVDECDLKMVEMTAGNRDRAIYLTSMTPEMYHRYFKEYENDPDLWLDKTKYVPYEYSEEKVDQYIKRQMTLKRKTLAIMHGEEIVGEVIIKNIEDHTCATLGICLKNGKYKDQGIGTQAEKLAVDYVFNELDIPTLYADSIQPNTRSQHVLEKVGFKYVNEDADFKYYQIDRGL